MLKNINIVLLLAFLPASDIYKQVRIYSDTEETLSILQTSGLDIDHSFIESGKWIEFAIPETRMYLLDETQLHYDELQSSSLPWFCVLHRSEEGKPIDTK